MTRFFLLIYTISIIWNTKTLVAQTNISGIINSYTNVTNIDSANNHITVSSTTNFSIGDRVLLIQMQGATIDESQSSSFGTITNYNNCGNYEFQTICNIQGNTIYFVHNLLNNYNISGKVQLITVPQYNNALISDSNLTAQAWDGTTGGILVFEVSDTLNMDVYNIDVTGKGFRGGNAVISGNGCNFVLDNSYYSSFTSTDEKALKGEGIAQPISGKECGRGPQANGGGGGNNHNGGGSGGGNYGSGGAGGERIKSTTFTCGSVTGANSKNLVNGYSNNKIFMGGGGGAGHGNNVDDFGESGLNGGGIVIIKANTIIGNGQSILADGATGTINAKGEGGGGAGAGGAVLIDAVNVTSTLNISVKGGDGTSIDNIGSSNCNGPGGGGGGGIVWISGGSLPPNITTTTTGGAAGVIVTTAQTNCTIGSNNGALDGADGATLTNLFMPEGTVINALGNLTTTTCKDFVSPSGNHIWNTTGTYSDTLVGGGINGCDSIITIHLTINTVDTSVTQSGDSLTANAAGASYQWLDCDNNYALINNDTNQSFTTTTNGNYAVEVTENGCIDTSSCYNIIILSISNNDFGKQLVLYPNPTRENITILFNQVYQDVNISLLDVTGRIIRTDDYKQTNRIEFKINEARGNYFLQVETLSGKSAIFKVLKE